MIPSDSGGGSADSPNAQAETYHAHGSCWWPQGDPGKLRAAAGAWDAAADGIERVASHGDAAVRTVKGSNTGDAINAFVAFWGRYSDGVGGGKGGDGPALTEAAKACRQVAKACRDYADGIDRARHEVEALIAAAATVLVIGVALTFLTAGASDAAAAGSAAALVGEAEAVETTLTELVLAAVRTAVSGAVKGAVFSAAYDGLIVQPIEMHFEPGRKFSLAEVGDWGLSGAEFGAVLDGGIASIRSIRMARMLGQLPTEIRTTGMTGDQLSRWRTEFGEWVENNPNASRQALNAQKGKLGEAVTADQLTANGEKVVQAQPRLNATGPGGKPVEFRPDFLVEDGAGNRYLVDSKNGRSARLTKNQKIGYPQVSTSGARAVNVNGVRPGSVVGPMRVEINQMDINPRDLLAQLKELGAFASRQPVVVSVPSAAVGSQVTQLLSPHDLSHVRVEVRPAPVPAGR